MPDKKKQQYRDVKSELENITGQDFVTYFDQYFKKKKAGKKAEKKNVFLSEEEKTLQAFQNLRRELGNLILMKTNPKKIH